MIVQTAANPAGSGHPPLRGRSTSPTARIPGILQFDVRTSILQLRFATLADRVAVFTQFSALNPLCATPSELPPLRSYSRSNPQAGSRR